MATFLTIGTRAPTGVTSRAGLPPASPATVFDMGVVDSQANPLSTDESTATLWREFCVRFQRQRSCAEASLQGVVAADPNFGIGRATAAILGSSFGCPDFDAPTEIEAARNGAAEHQWERSYIQAASAAAERGPLWGSVDQWFAHHDEFPSDLNGLRFAIVGATTSFDRVRREWRTCTSNAASTKPARSGSRSGYQRPTRQLTSRHICTGTPHSIASRSVRSIRCFRRLAETAAVSETPGATALVEPLAIALADRIDGDHAAAADRLLSIEHQLPLLGGSHAQREVFEDTLVETLIRAERTEEASRRLHARLQRRPSPLDQAWMAR